MASSPAQGAGSAFRLGVQLLSTTWNNAPWLYFSKVESGSPADQAGLKTDDLLRRINNVPIFTLSDFDAQIALAKQSGTITIAYKRYVDEQYRDDQAVIPVK